MAFVKIQLGSEEWTMIGASISQITFQNVGQYPIYINFTSNATSPSDNVGLVYPSYEGELKKQLTDFSQIVPNPSYVWAKSISNTGSVVVEQ